LPHYALSLAPAADLQLPKSKHHQKPNNNVSNYQAIKRNLTDFAHQIKGQLKGDTPAFEMAINDYADALLKGLPCSLSDARKNQYQEWLSLHACKLHKLAK
jgi:hypothetical protein